MKTLYLVRHAKSSWKYPYLSDHDRPLNKRGRKNAPEMGSRLKIQHIKPDIIISSTANRAYTTAQIIASKIDFSTDQIIPNSDLYHTEPFEVLKIVQKVDDKHQSLMIFGHNPELTWVTNQMANLDIDNIPTCGIVSLRFLVDRWSAIDLKKAELVFFDYPKRDR